jgi:hypothetical protein
MTVSEETSGLKAADTGGGYSRIAHPVHTIVLLAAMGFWAY